MVNSRRVVLNGNVARMGGVRTCREFVKKYLKGRDHFEFKCRFENI
jgi:hypothetical protein